MSVLGLHCCVQAFSSCGKRGLLYTVCEGFPLWWPLLLQSLGSRELQSLGPRLSSCGSQVKLPRGMWNIPGLGFKPVSPALEGGFLTAGQPGKPPYVNF